MKRALLPSIRILRSRARMRDALHDWHRPVPVDAGMLRATVLEWSTAVPPTFKAPRSRLVAYVVPRQRMSRLHAHDYVASPLQLQSSRFVFASSLSS